ncbi:hypothetical protein C2E23DRAFT_520690 [Lenzites betulinus]|nr:hypothetical protein C2E23DRAFT_520690 [Lenzites betulinus]
MCVCVFLCMYYASTAVVLWGEDSTGHTAGTFTHPQQPASSKLSSWSERATGGPTIENTQSTAGPHAVVAPSALAPSAYCRRGAPSAMSPTVRRTCSCIRTCVFQLAT